MLLNPWISASSAPQSLTRLCKISKEIRMECRRIEKTVKSGMVPQESFRKMRTLLNINQSDLCYACFKNFCKHCATAFLASSFKTLIFCWYRWQNDEQFECRTHHLIHNARQWALLRISDGTFFTKTLFTTGSGVSRIAIFCTLGCCVNLLRGYKERACCKLSIESMRKYISSTE